MLAPLGVPCGPINSIAQAFEEPQAAARGLAMKLDAGGLAIPSVRNPLRFSDAPDWASAPPPRLGEHTEAVLNEILGDPDQGTGSN